MPGGGAHVFFAPDGKSFATGGPNHAHAVLLWDAATGAPIEPFPGHTTPVQGVALSPDGRLLAVSGVGGEAVLLDWRTGREVAAFGGDPGRRYAFSADGRRLVTGGNAESVALVWEVPARR